MRPHPKNSGLTAALLALVEGVLAALAGAPTTVPPLADAVLAVVSVGPIIWLATAAGPSVVADA